MRNLIHNMVSRPFLVLGGFIALSLLLYIPIFQIGYISDDWGFVYQMEHAGWSAFKYNFTDQFFIPLSHFLGTLQYQITGGNAFIQHIIQVVIHGIIAWQIFMLCSGIAKKTSQLDLIPIGLLAGLLFLINPFQVESVAWLASKSYGYTLLFSILALRVLINSDEGLKKQILFWTLTLFAIHCKEWAYALPFIAFCVLKLCDIKIEKTFWLGLFTTIGISLLIRYFMLGTLIGGYESGQSFSLGIISLHTLAYFIKFTTYIRLASTEFLPLPLLGLISIVFVVFFFGLLIKHKVKKINIFYFFSIILLALLPIAGLEITSFLSLQSDRYSYFALVPFSIIYGYLIVNLKKWLGIITLSAICGIFILFTTNYNNRWQDASKAQFTFLEALVPVVANNTQVLLYNIPDTFDDVYCLRNGIEPYLNINNKIVEIEIYQRQNFYNFESGSFLNDSSEIQTNKASVTYVTFPKSNTSFDEIPFDWKWLDEFDQTLIYNNTQFTLLNK